MYVLGTSGNVISFTPNSTSTSTAFTWPSTNALLLGYNPINEKLYSWSGNYPNSILIRDLIGGTTTTTTIPTIALPTPTGRGDIIHNSVLNKIYVFSNNSSLSQSEVSIIDGVTNAYATTITSLPGLNSSFVYNPNNNKLYTPTSIYNCVGNNLVLDTTLPTSGNLVLALDIINNMIYTISYVSPTVITINKINCSTNTVISTALISGVFNYTSLRSAEFNYANGKVYVSRYQTNVDGGLYSINPTTGVSTQILSDGISAPYVYSPTNTIYVINGTATYEICGSL
jgi:hypothetical protein